jgi:hypothetical protein
MLSEESEFATQAVFYSQKAHAARRAMVESLAKYALLDRPKTALKLKNAIKRVRARSDDRHKLIHGVWTRGIDLATGAEDIYRTPLGADIMPEKSYSREDLKRVRDAMKDTVATLKEAIEPIDAAKRAKALELSARHMQKDNPLE